MSRFHVCVAVLLVTLAVFAPSKAAATTFDDVELVIAGSSALWQTAGLAAFQWTGSGTTGSCAGLGVTVTAPCHHYTNNTTKFNLNDTRPTKIGGDTNVDTGNLWIVWDSGTSTRHVWVYINVDSVVGDRCYFAQPRCNITAPSGYAWSTVGAQIPTTLWGADTVPPSDVQALFTSAAGLLVNTAATDIRPEDAQFAICRVDSVLGDGTKTTGSSTADGLDGLGYASNTSSTCPKYPVSLADGVGTKIESGFSTSTANPLAFNISGTDPFTNTAVPVYYVVNFGAEPVVFLFSRSSTANSKHGLRGAADATDAELQTIFSGKTCSAGVLAGTTGDDPINAFLREPLSGTMNTVEASVFRRPLETTTTPWKVLGVSQEKGVGSTNPLKDTGCTAGGSRSRAIGTSEMVKTAVAGAGGSGNDGIGYAFFSFGNVSKLAASANYGYLTLDGEDPLGLPATSPAQELPSCSYPCSEASFSTWLIGTDGSGTLNSFPALRAGKYTAWSVLRMVGNGAQEPLLEDLAKASFPRVVNETPDYIPITATVDSKGNKDPGLVQWHTHYQQRDADDDALGPAPSNGLFSSVHNPDLVTTDKGGDMGGCTITTTGITTATKNDYIQSAVTEVSKASSATCAKDRN
jgi:hypothetical protein